MTKRALAAFGLVALLASARAMGQTPTNTPTPTPTPTVTLTPTRTPIPRSGWYNPCSGVVAPGPCGIIGQSTDLREAGDMRYQFHNKQGNAVIYVYYGDGIDYDPTPVAIMPPGASGSMPVCGPCKIKAVVATTPTPNATPIIFNMSVSGHGNFVSWSGATP